jgi:hypothetical protein
MRKGAFLNGSDDLSLVLDVFLVAFVCLVVDFDLGFLSDLENTELPAEMIVDAEEYFFSVESK